MRRLKAGRHSNMLMPLAPLQKIERLPDTSDLRRWADYVELLSLVNLDQEISKDDMLDRITEGKDLDARDDGVGPEIGGDQEGLDDLANVAQHNDRQAHRVDEIFTHLEYRQATYKDFYPFTVIGHSDVLAVRRPLTIKHKFYTFFLLSSNLRYVPRTTQEVLTDDFELVSAAVLRQCLPKGANVHVFGKNSHTPARYRGLLWDKINRLAEDLGEIVHVPKSDFRPSDSGDNGLDIVGWVPTGDDVGGYLLVFGQCACTDQWVAKQHSSSADAWRPIMTFKAPPSNMAFVPFCLRQSNGSWSASSDIHGSILIDRLRFIHFLQHGYTLLKGQRSYSVIQDVLRQRESVV